MNIFIVGNAGFVGAHLTHKLVSIGHNVIGFDIIQDNPQKKTCECLIGDVCNKKSIMEAMKGKEIDLIIDLAAKHHDFGISEKEFFEVNEKGTKNLIECATTFGIKKFIFFSSVAVYGNQIKPTTEETTLNPTSPYGRSKLAGEKLLESWTKDDSNRETLVIRPVVIFGPENYANMYHLIKKICDKKFIFIGKGDNVKSIAYVENLVEATIFLLNYFRPGIDYYNYCDEPQMTIKDIVDIICRYAEINIPRIRLPLFLALGLTWPFDILEKITGHLFPITAKRIKKFNTPTHFKADKIRKLGFKQPVDLKEGFRRTLKWFKSDESNR
jgi:nucleoside-diphosphate-sugar epimerase